VQLEAAAAVSAGMIPSENEELNELRVGHCLALVHCSDSEVTTEESLQQPK